jgi:transposase-like protein
MVVKINGVRHYLWRAVDQDGVCLNVLMQRRRNAKAAKKFFRKLLKGPRYVPRVLVTDELGSYQVAHREMLSSVEHRRSKYLNNRAENSHQPTRVRERVMKRFYSGGQAQRFCSAHGVISSHVRPGRHLMSGRSGGEPRSPSGSPCGTRSPASRSRPEPDRPTTVLHVPRTSSTRQVDCARRPG